MPAVSSCSPTLQWAAERARQVAAGAAAQLNDEDRRWLTAAFHRAEALAHAALLDAIDQLDAPYVEPLREQLADEERHVAVFADWQDEPPAPIRAPATRQRTEPVWFTTLLINEVAGYCQFEMLAALAEDPARRAQVEAVAADEVVHIERLVGWLEPWRPERSWAMVDRMVATFIGRLDGRMRQFLPRPELAELRGEMAALISDTLRRLLPSAQSDSLS